MTARLLEISGIDVRIDTVQVLRDFSLGLAAGEMVSLTGRNGAGKTTLLRTVMGHLKADRGSIELDGESLPALPAHARAALGIGYMPEDRGLVPELTVEENILLPVWVSKSLAADARLAFVYDVLPELKAMRERRALQLSGGQQKLAALARALAVGTRLLLLDEPFEGVAPALAERLAEAIGQLRGGQFAVLIAQSEVHHAAALIDSEVIIERGSNVER